MGKYHKRIQVEGSDEFDLAVNITGKGAPTEDTEADPGMVYMDEDSENGDLYKCIRRTETEEKVVYTWKKMPSQEEVDSLTKAIADKLDASKLPEAVNTALEQAKESGEFKGEKGDPGEPGQPGAPGADYVLTEADKTEIAEIAAGLVDVPEGGEWKLLVSETLAEDVQSIYIKNETLIDEIMLIFKGRINDADDTITSGQEKLPFRLVTDKITSIYTVGMAVTNRQMNLMGFLHIWRVGAVLKSQGSQEAGYPERTTNASNFSVNSETDVERFCGIYADTANYIKAGSYMEVWIK